MAAGMTVQPARAAELWAVVWPDRPVPREVTSCEWRQLIAELCTRLLPALTVGGDPDAE